MKLRVFGLIIVALVLLAILPALSTATPQLFIATDRNSYVAGDAIEVSLAGDNQGEGMSVDLLWLDVRLVQTPVDRAVRWLATPAEAWRVLDPVEALVLYGADELAVAHKGRRIIVKALVYAQNEHLS